MEPRTNAHQKADAERLVDAVRQRYGRIAEQSASCCGPQGACGTSAEATSVALGYSPADLAQVPAEADLGLGCGAPIGLLDLKAGETVLDLGSGGGLDAFLAARKVGPGGKVIGVDMTPQMLEKARANAERLGLPHVEFREGRLERLPLEDGTVDAVTSNCVINLVPDKAAVFAEVARVLRPGGRLVISDILLDGRLPEALARDLEAYVGCISGAVPREEYLDLLRQVGLTDIEVLSDSDYAAKVVGVDPARAEAFCARAGVQLDELLGVVHSVTLRAVKPL